MLPQYPAKFESSILQLLLNLEVIRTVYLQDPSTEMLSSVSWIYAD